MLWLFSCCIRFFRSVHTHGDWGVCRWCFVLLLSVVCGMIVIDNQGGCPKGKQMKIYSLIIHDEVANIHPVYEVHSWEKAEEIIKKTMELADGKPFTWEVVGKAN